MSISVLSMGDRTLFQLACTYYYISGIDLNALSDEILKTSSPSNRLSNNRTQRGPQNEDNFFEHGEHTRNLLKCIEAIASDMGMELSEDIWAQIHHPYESCNLHDHVGLNNEASFVFYVKVPEGSGSLYFDFPPVGIATIDPIEGMLIVFPSYLKHAVNKNLGTELRISVAGNLKRK